MNKDDRIQHAIDESLGSVHFNAHDMRSVMRAVREKDAPCRAPVRRKRIRFEALLTAAMVVIVAAPLSVFAFRALRAQPSDITTALSPLTAGSGKQTLPTTDNAQPNEDIVSGGQSTLSAAISESEAIQAARACFEAQCDTSVFSFEEYTVSVQTMFEYGEAPSSYAYEVTLNSIYDNGCIFSVVVSAADGQIISYSTPHLATMPSSINTASPELQAWYEKYGEYIFTWPLDVQAEFSRRYEGAMLRMPRDGEKDEQYIAAACVPKFHDMLIKDADESRRYSLACYPMLYAERAFADGQARYRIYCFAFDEETNAPLDTYLLSTMLAADGTIESTELLSTSVLEM